MPLYKLDNATCSFYNEFKPSLVLISGVNLFLVVSEVYVISDIVNLLHHFSYVLTPVKS